MSKVKGPKDGQLVRLADCIMASRGRQLNQNERKAQRAQFPAVSASTNTLNLGSWIDGVKLEWL